MYDEALPQIVAVDRSICPLIECGENAAVDANGDEEHVFTSGNYEGGLENSAACGGRRASFAIGAVALGGLFALF